MYLRDLLVALIVFGSLPMILRKPHVGILIWAWLSYMNPHKLSWGFAHDFPFALIVALVILASLLVSKEEKKIPWTPEAIVLLCFLGWMFITTLNASYPDRAWFQWNKVWKIQLMTFVTIMIMQERERVHNMIGIIAASLAFYGVKGGVFTITTGGSYAVYGPGGSFIAGNNEIGLALIMTVPLLRYIQLQTTKSWLKNFLNIAMFLCVVSIIGTQSRGALVGLVTMTLFLIAKSRNKALLIFFLVLSLPAIISFMPEKWHNRMHTIQTYEQDESAMGRLNAWQMAINLAKNRPLGGGFECFQVPFFKLYAPNPDMVHDAHSIYFETLGEHGFIGLALFLSLGVLAWRRANLLIKQSQSRPDLVWIKDLAAMLQVSLVGYASAGAFLGLANFDLYYNLIACLIICKAIVDRTPLEALSNPVTAPPRPRTFVKPALGSNSTRDIY